MNFIFSWQKQYFTHSLRSFVNIVLPLENKIHIFAPPSRAEMNTLQLSKPYIPDNNRGGSRAFIPIGKYLHSLSLPLRLAPPNVNTFLIPDDAVARDLIIVYNISSQIRKPRRDFRLQTSDFRLQTSDFRLLTSGFRLQTSDLA